MQNRKKESPEEARQRAIELMGKEQVRRIEERTAYRGPLTASDWCGEMNDYRDRQAFLRGTRPDA